MLQEVSGSFLSRVYKAVYTNDLEALQHLVYEYKAWSYDPRVRARHKKCFSRLLVKVAREFRNDIALQLILLGADVNYFGKLALTTQDVNWFKPVTLDKYADDQYPYEFKPKVLPATYCYLLDILIYFDNYRLFNRIGKDAFDLSIYQVNHNFYLNTLNTKVNPNAFSVHTTYSNFLSRHNAVFKFEHELTIRLLWCSLFCNWAIKQDRVDLLHDLLTKYKTLEDQNVLQWTKQTFTHDLGKYFHDTICFKPYTTFKIVNLYLDAIASIGGSRKWLDSQYLFDQYLNLSIAKHGANLNLARAIDRDCILPLSLKNQASREVSEMLSKHLYDSNSIAALMLYMVPVGAFCFGFALQNILMLDTDPVNYALFAGSSLCMLFVVIEFLKIVSTIALRAAYPDRLECLGSMDTIAVRAYTYKMLAEIIQPTLPLVSIQNSPILVPHFAFNIARKKPKQQDKQPPVVVEEDVEAQQPLKLACI